MNQKLTHRANPVLAALTLLIALAQALPNGTSTARAATADAVNGASSQSASLKAGPVRDIEAELRKKFDYPVGGGLIVRPIRRIPLFIRRTKSKRSAPQPKQ